MTGTLFRPLTQQMTMTLEYINEQFRTEDTEIDGLLERLHLSVLNNPEADAGNPVKSLGRGAMDLYRTDERVHLGPEQTRSGLASDVDTEKGRVTLKQADDTDPRDYVIPAVERDEDGVVTAMAVIGPDGMYALEREQDGGGFSYHSRRPSTSDSGGGYLDERDEGFGERASVLFRIADNWDRLETDPAAPLEDPDIEYERDKPEEAFEKTVERSEYQATPESYRVTLSDQAHDELKSYQGAGIDEGVGKTLMKLSEDPGGAAERNQGNKYLKSRIRGTDQSDNALFQIDEDREEVYVARIGSHKDETVNSS